jgi:hypothetical protein
VVWTTRAISAASLLRTIVGTPTWTVDGLTVTGEQVVGLRALAKLADGIDGQDYAVTVTAATTDLVLVKTAILPVRLPVRTYG